MLEHLFVDGVRNLKEVELVPHPRLTVLVGDNGQGKTNLLEAIHLASALRPLRPLERASDLMPQSEGAATTTTAGVITARFEIDGPLEVCIEVLPTGRKARVGGKAVRDVATLAGRLAVVSFVPDDAAMVRGSPGDRRRGLDRFAFSLFPSFAAASRRFEEALEQRNRLLKDLPVDEDALDAFTPPFVAAAAALTRLRALAVAQWSPVFADEARIIGGAGLLAQMAYTSGLLGDEDDDATPAAERSTASLEARLDERLRRGRFIERKRRATLCGPQHDDVGLWNAGQRARFLASQGEARALVLAMKLAAVRLLTTTQGKAPLLLLDDLGGELDHTRAGRLLQSIDEHGVQAFVTTPSTSTLPALGDHKTVMVRAGRLSG